MGMDFNTVLAKTEEGRAAIADRSKNLSPKQRQLLIMIDGKKTLKEIVPNIDEEVIARVKALADEGFITGDLNLTPPAAVVSEAVVSEMGDTGLAVRQLPGPAQLDQIRRVLAMCSQQYLNDELDTMLIDVFDHLMNATQLQFCLDQWLRRMRLQQPDSITNMYVAQVRNFL